MEGGTRLPGQEEREQGRAEIRRLVTQAACYDNADHHVCRWSAEGAWLRGMDSGHTGDRLTSRQIRQRDMGPVHRVWYK